MLCERSSVIVLSNYNKFNSCSYMQGSYYIAHFRRVSHHGCCYGSIARIKKILYDYVFFFFKIGAIVTLQVHIYLYMATDCRAPSTEQMQTPSLCLRFRKASLRNVTGYHRYTSTTITCLSCFTCWTQRTSHQNDFNF